MNHRTAVLRAVHEADDHAVAEEEVIERFPDGEYRSVKAALQGLAESGVVNKTHPFGSEPFYSISNTATKAELRQALESVSAAEASEHIMQASSMFGNPNEHTNDDLFDGLL